MFEVVQYSSIIAFNYKDQSFLISLNPSFLIFPVTRMGYFDDQEHLKHIWHREVTQKKTLDFPSLCSIFSPNMHYLLICVKSHILSLLFIFCLSPQEYELYILIHFCSLMRFKCLEQCLKHCRCSKNILEMNEFLLIPPVEPLRKPGRFINHYWLSAH